ncbi:hypothetical protein BH720_025040 [Desertifilum tharense IPPAS B-1220]|uniref:Uncharacterized protein n=1 Tax=Desertifilum tharense IPPAS B-1220 TaxID=1781255 RepID=A0ACD5GUC1_9CYAN|nr:hypothetical protein [Desertifilum sp.]
MFNLQSIHFLPYECDSQKDLVRDRIQVLLARFTDECAIHQSAPYNTGILNYDFRTCSSG